MSRDAAFPRLVSLACHDLRTPLATVSGFAHTLERLDDLAPPADRYVRMMLDAAGEMAELLDLLGLLARIEAGRYEPTPVEADTLELANSVAARLGEERVQVTGQGGAVADRSRSRPSGLSTASFAVRSATAGSTRWPSRRTGLR